MPKTNKRKATEDITRSETGDKLFELAIKRDEEWDDLVKSIGCLQTKKKEELQVSDEESASQNSISSSDEESEKEALRRMKKREETLRRMKEEEEREAISISKVYKPLPMVKTRSQHNSSFSQLIEFQKKQLKGELIQFYAIWFIGQGNRRIWFPYYGGFKLDLKDYRKVSADNAMVKFYEMCKSKVLDMSVFKETYLYELFERNAALDDEYEELDAENGGKRFLKDPFYNTDIYDAVDMFFEDPRFIDLMKENSTLWFCDDKNGEFTKDLQVLHFMKHGKITPYRSNIILPICKF
jgi:hypothetical protein